MSDNNLLQHITRDSPERAWWIGGLILWGMLPLTAIVHLLDGTDAWAKPLKFEFSFGLHFLTAALFASLLGEAWRRGVMMRWLVPLSLAGVVAEMVYMLVQAARHEPSHFNVATPFYAFMFYGVMGTGAVLIIMATLGVGVASWRDGASRMREGLRAGVASGLILGSLMTLVFGFYMAASLSHDVGAVVEGASKLPGVGWSTRSGDLRMPHFFSNHTMQLLPLVGFLADRWLAGVWATRVTLAFAALWTGLCIGLFAMTLRGMSLLAVKDTF